MNDKPNSHNGKINQTALQDALPVVIQFLDDTSVADELSNDLQAGMAMQDLLKANLRILNRIITNAANLSGENSDQ